MDRTLRSLSRHVPSVPFRSRPSLHDSPSLRAQYPSRDDVARQTLPVLEHYPGLLNPEQTDFTYDDGRVELLLALTGVLPVPINNTTYHCPVAVWLPLDFPAKPPIVLVQGSDTLAVRKSKHVDTSGRVTIPYLEHWDKKSEVRFASFLSFTSFD